MAAVELEWIPETLYNTAISAVVDNYSRSRRDIRSLPENIQFDVYYKVRYYFYHMQGVLYRVTSSYQAKSCLVACLACIIKLAGWLPTC